MKGKRLWHTIRLFLIRTPDSRAQYCKRHHVFGAIGNNCRLMNRVVPLYANLIKIGNNVSVGSNVSFNTHDGIHRVLNNLNEDVKDGVIYREGLGCIEIGDNVFIGAGSIINNNVRIGDNVIVTAGTLVNNDIPSNSVVRGVPAKRICSFDAYCKMRAVKNSYPKSLKNKGEYINEELADWLWKDFYTSRNLM